MHRGLLTRLFVHVYPVDNVKTWRIFFVVREKRTQVKMREYSVHNHLCLVSPKLYD